ncbi:MAG: hypothetical protein H7281_12650 [Bacteriovorax sp.]|nr:hypothetical protein [Bacteriovorax sp.]
MPVKDGFQFCLEKDNNARISYIPVVILSADGQVKDYQPRINARAFLRKPLDIYNLIKVIEDIIA